MAHNKSPIKKNILKSPGSVDILEPKSADLYESQLPILNYQWESI